MKKRYVITSGKGIKTILHRGDYFKKKNAQAAVKRLKKKGKNNVRIKWYKKGETGLNPV